MTSALRVLAPAFLASLLAMADITAASSDFLAPTRRAGRESRELAEQRLLTELTVLLGHGTNHERLAHIENVLRPMYMALPKADDGGIDQGVARYAISRYFLTHRGWHINGMAQDGQSWNASSATKMLKSMMPSFTFEILEERMGHKHLGLGELAVLVATVEDLVHSESLALLEMAYKVHDFSMDQPLKNRREENLVIKTFVLFFTMQHTRTAHNSSSVLGHLKTVPKTNPGWRDNMLWVEDLKQSLKYEHRAEHGQFSNENVYYANYPAMVQLAERIIDGFGLFQDIQCKEFKNMLMDLEGEERNDGRVLLANFYRPYMQGKSGVFVESPEFLEHLGSLDDSNPNKPSVIVPNFLYGRQFCLASDTEFLSYCCVDQCSMLMESLERSIAHPVAPPSVIAGLVAELPSDTVAAPRNLSDSLLWKLDLVAEEHGGQVPLHGRLFAQWLHHAFPNECPQPRAPGVVEAQMTHPQWQDSRNTSSYVSKEVMQEVMDRAVAAETEDSESAEEPLMQWTEGEELLTSLDLQRLGSPGADQLQPPHSDVLHNILCLVAMCAAAASIMAIFAELVHSSAAALRPQGLKEAGALPQRESAAKSHSI